MAGPAGAQRSLRVAPPPCKKEKKLNQVTDVALRLVASFS